MTTKKAVKAKEENVTRDRPLSLWERIRRVQTEAPPVFKDGDLEVGKNKSKPVASIESVLETYQPLCDRYGLVIVPVRQEIKSHEVRPGKYDSKVECILAECIFRCVAVDTGESHEFSILTGGQSHSDKATGSMHTYSLKYAYKQLFSARSTEDDPDLAPADPAKEDNRKKESKSQDDDSRDEDKRKAQQALYTKCSEAIKKEFPAANAADGMVPKFALYKEKYKEIFAETKGLAAETEKHLVDFARYWWHCLNVTGNSDVDKAEETFEKDAKAGLIHEKNAAVIRGMIAKRKSASDENERQPGDDGDEE